MGLKLAVSGKGGVGKTTVSALLARKLAAAGRVVAIDADPVPSLAGALGFAAEPPIVPLTELSELIAERTGAEPGSVGSYFRLKPRVEDLPEQVGRTMGNIRLLVMGTIERGGAGCACPQSVLLRALVAHLLLRSDEALVMDMEAGVEHLGRATASAVDRLLVVVSPGQRSHEAARRVRALADDIGMRALGAVANQVQGPEDLATIERGLDGIPLLGWLPVSASIAQADRAGAMPFPDLAAAPPQLDELVTRLVSGS